MSLSSQKKSKQRDRDIEKLTALPPPKELPLTASRNNAGFSFHVETITLT